MKSESSSLSRRAVLRGALAASAYVAAAGTSLITANRASAASTSTPVGLADTDAGSIENYVRVMPASGDTTGAWTLLDGVHEEYRKAIRIFPLPLPEGYTFPTESQVQERAAKAGTRFSVGMGGSEAFLFWQNATMVAAYAAHQRGDQVSSLRHLNSMHRGYSSNVRGMYIADADGVYIRDVIAPALRGNYVELRTRCIDRLNNDHIFRQIARAAGDAT